MNYFVMIIKKKQIQCRYMESIMFLLYIVLKQKQGFLRSTKFTGHVNEKNDIYQEVEKFVLKE